MSVQRPGGATPLERLSAHYEREGLTCSRCGYEDEGGHWRAETSGDRVRYRHRCPSCGSVSTKVLRLA